MVAGETPVPIGDVHNMFRLLPTQSVEVSDNRNVHDAQNHPAYKSAARR